MKQPCCACGEAKYQLTFKGLWSAETHKKDWPTKNGKTKTTIFIIEQSIVLFSSFFYLCWCCS